MTPDSTTGEPPPSPYGAPPPPYGAQPPPWAQPPQSPYGGPQQPPWAQPPQSPGGQQPPWGPPQQQYEYVYGQGYGPPSQRIGTNGMAVASLVLGIVGALGCCWGVLSILALVFGFSGRKQIDASGGRQGGRGMATAGIVLGFVGIAVTLMWLAFVVLGDGQLSPVPLR